MAPARYMFLNLIFSDVIYNLLLFSSSFFVSELQSLPSIPKQEHELPSQSYAHPAHPKLAAASTPKGLPLIQGHVQLTALRWE